MALCPTLTVTGSLKELRYSGSNLGGSKQKEIILMKEYIQLWSVLIHLSCIVSNIIIVIKFSNL